MSVARIALFGTVVLLGAAVLAQQPPAPTRPTKAQVARWVAQLGDNDFNVREEASRLLWQAGEPAEPALQEALKGTDAEVSRRAREILDKFKWGLYPSTPRELVALITRYQQAEGDGKAAVVRDLLDVGPAGCRTLLKIVSAESSPENQKALRNQIASALSRALPRLLDQKELPLLDDLLAAGMEADEQLGIRNAAAWWLLTGQLDRKIEQYKALATGKDKGREVEILVLLHRAGGDLVAARETARRAEREDLVNALLYEVGDWKEEAWPLGPIGDGREIEKLGYRAACRRLAGRHKEFEEVLAEIRKRTEKVPADNSGELLHLAKVLLLNHQPNEALALLARSKGHTVARFEILMEQHKFAEALTLIEKAATDNPGQADLELRQAELLGVLGEKDKARAIFARYFGQLKPEAEVSWAAQLLESEVAAGLLDDAFKHAVQAMTVSRAGPDQFFAALFPRRDDTAQSLWVSLRRLFPQEDAGARMNRLRRLMNGQATRQELAKAVGADITLLAGDGWQALALATVACRQEDLARQCLDKAGTTDALLLQGDLLACAKKWDEATQLYARVWEKDRSPLALYLSGKAMVRAGQRQEGKRRMELARLLPLGNESARQAFALGLATRGDRSGALREFELLFRLSTPGSGLADNAMARVATYADQLGQQLLAADFHERFTLNTLGANHNLWSFGAYISTSAWICRERIQGLLAAGKVNEVLLLLARAEEIWPGRDHLAAIAVPALERLGHKKEADELFARTIAVHENVLRQFPRCAAAHENLAWASAGCQRNLDAALKHAQKAVELVEPAPQNAYFFTTLAEVYLQRGDQTRAVEMARKAVQLEPHLAMYRLRLKRVAAGDPKAPLLSPLIFGDPKGRPLPFAEDEGD